MDKPSDLDQWRKCPGATAVVDAWSKAHSKAEDKRLYDLWTNDINHVEYLTRRINSMICQLRYMSFMVNPIRKFLAGREIAKFYKHHATAVTKADKSLAAYLEYQKCLNKPLKA